MFRHCIWRNFIAVSVIGRRKVAKFVILCCGGKVKMLNVTTVINGIYQEKQRSVKKNWLDNFFRSQARQNKLNFFLNLMKSDEHNVICRVKEIENCYFLSPSLSLSLCYTTLFNTCQKYGTIFFANANCGRQ